MTNPTSNHEKSDVVGLVSFPSEGEFTPSAQHLVPVDRKNEHLVEKTEPEESNEEDLAGKFAALWQKMGSAGLVEKYEGMLAKLEGKQRDRFYSSLDKRLSKQQKGGGE